jgi:hypothetical protein
MLTAVLAVLVAALLAAAAIAVRRRPPPPRTRRSPAKPRGEVRMIDPRELLFSLPTIYSALPAVEPQPAGTAAASGGILHEDDWRQEEFVAGANAEYVASTLSEITSHRAVHAVGLGFREVHTREEPPVSLGETGVTYDEVTRVLGVSDRGALYFNNRQLEPVAGGFTLEIHGGGFVYGQTNPAGQVTALGLGLVGDPESVVPKAVAQLTAHFGLLFVDWVRGVVVQPGDEVGVRDYVRRVVGEDRNAAT